VTALGDLRRRTLGRATRGYLVWIGRAVGWWTIVYLAFWAVVFAIAGAETLVRLDEPLSAAVPLVAAWGVAVAFAAHVLAGRAPPVVLDRRDLYRLALAPTEPYAVLRWRLTVRRALAVAFGAVVGAVWSLLAPPLFHVQAPWAAPALALVALAYVDVAWLRYAGFRRDDADGRSARRAGILLAAGLGLTGLIGPALARLPDAPSWAAAVGPAGALASAHGLVLLLPALAATAAAIAVRRSLRAAFPPRFAAQSLVLTQLQAMRTLQMLAGLAGMASPREADAATRERLLATLHDRPGAARPRRSRRPPPVTAAPWRAIAWRTTSAWVRLPRWAQLRLAVGAFTAAAAVIAAAPVLHGGGVGAVGAAGVATGAGAAAAGAPSLGAAFVGAAAVLAAAWWLARVAATLIGPALPRGTLPVEAAERTRGRLVPALVVLAVAAVPVVVAAALFTGGGATAPWGVAPATVLAAIALTLTTLAVLEKYATWSGAAAGGWEATLVAALATALPALVFGMFGAPAWAFTTQVVLAAVVWWWPT
jgi:hypothetical protein